MTALSTLPLSVGASHSATTHPRQTQHRNYSTCWARVMWGIYGHVLYTHCVDTRGLTHPFCWDEGVMEESYHILILHSVKDYETSLSDPCCARWIIFLARMDIFIPWYWICSHFLAVTITLSITGISLVWSCKQPILPSSTFSYLNTTH